MADNADGKGLPEAEVITLSSDEEEAAETHIKAENASVCSRASASRESIDSSSGSIQKAESIFENFLALCSKCLEMPRDQPVVAKLRKVYGLMDFSYKVSDDFAKYLKKSMDTLTPSNVYEMLIPVLDHMKSKRIMRSSRESSPVTSRRETKREVQIARLEDLLERLDKKIKEISEKEVNWDDEDSSDYLVEDRLKRKFVRTYQLLCKMKGASASLSGKKKIVYSGTRYHEINQHISKLINKSKNAPDYHDVMTAVSEAAHKSRLELNEQECQRIAREAFPDIVTTIQKNRVHDFLSTFGTYQTDQLDAAVCDPALTDEQLKEKLSQNLACAKTKLDEVFEKYERLQDERNPAAGADDVVEDEQEGVDDEEETEEEDDEETKDASDEDIAGDSDPDATDEDLQLQEAAHSPDTQEDHAAVNGREIKVENGIGRKKVRSPSPPEEARVKRPRTTSCAEIVILD